MQMGASSGSNFQQQLHRNMLPPRKHHRLAELQTSLSISLAGAGGYADMQELAPNSDQVHEPPSESACSRETIPLNAVVIKKLEKKKENEKELPQQQVARRVSSTDRLSLHNVAQERVELVSEKMMFMPDELLEELKVELRAILEVTGGSQHREEFLYLQKLVQGRVDLTEKALSRVHKVQLEILVAIKTGIQAFLHPNISLPQNQLVEIFTYKRCRNIACQNAIPADDCQCEICTGMNGFCNLCMCVICNKFDFEVNTCRWIGCDLCSHWTHTDCAIRVGLIRMGPSLKSGMGMSEMIFRCQACNRASELLGWVKDVFQHCVSGWGRDALMRELDVVSRIFRGSEDARGRKLFEKCEDLIDMLKNGVTDSAACRILLPIFREIETDSAKNPETEEPGRLLAPEEACDQIAEVVREAVMKMEVVAKQKLHMFKRARVALEACERELEDKAGEFAELKRERQRKKQQVEELESIMKLKQAEAEMFQLKAKEAKQEAERLQCIAFAKSDKAEQDFASRYLKHRLDEAEAEKQYLFEEIKCQESQRAS